MARYLLDADTVIDYLHGFPPAVALITELYERGDDIAVSGVVVAEIYAGLNTSQENGAATLLEHCTYLHIGLDSAQDAGRWRKLFRSRGYALTLSDALIAATAKEHGCVLVSGDAVFQHIREIDVFPLPRAKA